MLINYITFIAIVFGLVTISYVLGSILIQKMKDEIKDEFKNGRSKN